MGTYNINAPITGMMKSGDTKDGTTRNLNIMDY